MSETTPIDILEHRVSALEKEIGNVSNTLPTMREALAELDTKTSMVHDEMDMLLQGLSNQNERMGQMREARAGGSTRGCRRWAARRWQPALDGGGSAGGGDRHGRHG